MHSRHLLSSQLLDIWLGPLVWIGILSYIEKLRQPNIERGQNGLNSPHASQQLIIDDLFTRVRVEVLPVHDDTYTVIKMMRHGTNHASFCVFADFVQLPKQRPDNAD